MQAQNDLTEKSDQGSRAGVASASLQMPVQTLVGLEEDQLPKRKPQQSHVIARKLKLLREMVSVKRGVNQVGVGRNSQLDGS